jgi:hypothetical protein
MRVALARTYVRASLASDTVELVLEPHDLDFIIVFIVRIFAVYEFEDVPRADFVATTTADAFALIERDDVLWNPLVTATGSTCNV